MAKIKVACFFLGHGVLCTNKVECKLERVKQNTVEYSALFAFHAFFGWRQGVCPTKTVNGTKTPKETFRRALVNPTAVKLPCIYAVKVTVTLYKFRLCSSFIDLCCK